ncbi:fungal chitosanase of glycosyl hydrolase group 75-domain-containing protein [Sphaerosporella brunnea]|uniref:Endo-chitosanase n=1 Tax=Sphaerosporella brunnea TaxID=1250544 RepID=A0A5J5ESZ4_9PEZI|nr:fungal chitosanase of glycosyl hydrolase group 75-domain-containing protein [Sphaerosporella brunnea]
MRYSSLIALSLAVVGIRAYNIPPALQTFYNGVKNGGCKSWLDNNHNLQDGHGHKGFGFCTDTAGALYVSGPGELADMDIDCDGAHKCTGDGSFQSGTAFDDILQSQGYGIESLDASKHTFVVLGTCDVAVDTLTGGPIQPLSLVAVVCNNQLHYAVFGDTNGCDDDNFTGEASLSLGQLCFPNEGLNGDNGHDAHDVLYLAFTGKNAVPGPHGAAWTASNPQDFEASLKSLGDTLIAGLFGGSGSTPTTNTGPTTAPSPTSSCTWAGHCAGATCSSDNDCSDALTCQNGKCAAAGGVTTTSTPKPTPTCSWAGHCAGASCSSDDDCSDSLTCQNGKCAA